MHHGSIEGAANQTLDYGKQVEIVLVDCLILETLQEFVVPTNPWDNIGVVNGGLTTIIRSISYVGSTCKKWHTLVSLLVDFAALRLAQFDLVSVLHYRKFDGDAFMMETFNRNMREFGKFAALSPIVKPSTHYIINKFE